MEMAYRIELPAITNTSYDSYRLRYRQPARPMAHQHFSVLFSLTLIDLFAYILCRKLRKQIVEKRHFVLHRILLPSDDEMSVICTLFFYFSLAYIVSNPIDYLP